jgi:hypothetical protein
MIHQPIHYEWKVIEEGDWERKRWTSGVPADQPGVDGTVEATLLTQFWRGLVVVLATISLTGATFAPRQEEPSWAESAVAPTLQLEAQAWATQDGGLLDRLIDPGVSARFQDEWRFGLDREATATNDYGASVLGVEAVGNLVQVQMSVTQPVPQWWISTPHRETRFYRQTGDSWMRTVPGDDFWGPVRSVETAHLRFEFRDRDLPAVIAAADRMETAFVRAHRWLGVPLPAEAEKLTFAIVPDLVRGWGGYSSRQQMTSPILAKVPVDLSDSDYLAQQIISRIASRTLNQLHQDDEQATNTYQWRTMLWALSGWFRTELAQQRTPWHRQAEALFAREVAHALPLTLNQIENQYPSWRVDQEAMMLEYMMAETIIDYIITTYGPEQLPALVLTFNDNHSWLGIIPQLFDQTTEEFEAGWNDYLQARFGPTLAMEP